MSSTLRRTGLPASGDQTRTVMVCALAVKAIGVKPPFLTVTTVDAAIERHAAAGLGDLAHLVRTARRIGDDERVPATFEARSNRRQVRRAIAIVTGVLPPPEPSTTVIWSM